MKKEMNKIHLSMSYLVLNVYHIKQTYYFGKFSKLIYGVKRAAENQYHANVI